MSGQVANVPRAMPEAEEDERRRIERECREIMVRMGYCLDSGKFEEFVDYFTADAVWRRRGTELKGREAILAQVLRRSPTLILRHVFTNFMVDVHDRDHAHCQAYMLGFRYDSGEKSATPPPFRDANRALWIYHDDLVRTEAGWKVARRSAERILEDPE
ncbi:MAG: nuclear transport factor 2 family protein [Rhodospirillaceae bacterium]|nr:nuclear transport factor 2 family protein [Rhodospirillaceae bacterium]